MLVDIIAIIMGCSIPLSIIGSFVYLRKQKLQSKALNSEEREVLLQLKSENAELKSRLDNLEIIISEENSNRLSSSTKEALQAAQTGQLALNRAEQIMSNLEELQKQIKKEGLPPQ